MTEPTRAALIWNPVAGGPGGAALEDVRARLVELGLALEVHETCPSTDADACTRAALAGGAELVIAAGGDGTVSAVASVLAGGDVPLAILPRGTANSIAAALEIPTDLDGALAQIAAGEARALDLLRVNDRVAVLHCMIGFHADAVGGTSRDAKNRWGILAYLASGLRELADLEPFEVELETESHQIRCRAIAVGVANLAPTKTFLAQGPSVVAGDDGLVDVTIVAATGLAEAVATGLHLLRAAVLHEAATRDNVGYFRCRWLRVTASPPQHYLVDGELAGHTPVTIDCVPHRLRVLAPGGEGDRPPAEAKLSGLPDLDIEPRDAPPMPDR